MKKNKPIHQVISEVLRERNVALSAEEIFTEITKRDLYPFKAQDPLHVVQSNLKRHCIDLNFPSARRTKYFKREPGSTGNLYGLLEAPIRVEPNVYKIKQPGKRIESIITVAPEDETAWDPITADSCHTEIQWRLLDLGSKLGMSVWAPKADRGRTWNGHRISDVPHLLSSLPLQFARPVMRIISYIDVIWLEQGAIVAAFEVEHTSTVYSGLLRMSDLMTMQPNSDINWYLVAPDARSEKFATEITRPTFSALRKPLHRICRFLPYSKLIHRLDTAKEFLKHLKPNFLDDISESYNPASAFED